MGQQVVASCMCGGRKKTSNGRFMEIHSRIVHRKLAFCEEENSFENLNRELFVTGLKKNTNFSLIFLKFLSRSALVNWKAEASHSIATGHFLRSLDFSRNDEASHPQHQDSLTVSKRGEKTKQGHALFEKLADENLLCDA